MRAKVNFAEEKNAIMKDDMRKLRRFDSKSSSSNVNNNAFLSKKRQSSDPDNGGQNKFVRESLSYD